MKVLALETSGSNCSVALLDEEKVIADFNCNTGTTHSQNLMPMLEQVQKFSNISLDEIDYFACSVGPGSFTGLRIGIASVKGMALSLNKKVVAVPSLVGLAYNVPFFDGIICSVLDARNDNVYAALFEIKDRPHMMGSYISESVTTLIDTLKNSNRNILFVGDGAISYKEVFEEEFKEKAFFMPYHLNFQNAVSVAKAAIDKIKIGEIDDYNTITPLYLKKSQAERMLDLSEKNTNS